MGVPAAQGTHGVQACRTALPRPAALMGILALFALPAEKPGSWLFSAGARLFGQSASRGAASLIYAAAASELDGGLRSVAGIAHNIAFERVHVLLQRQAGCGFWTEFFVEVSVSSLPMLALSCLMLSTSSKGICNLPPSTTLQARAVAILGPPTSALCAATSSIARR